MYGEVSLNKYSSAATTLRNFVVNYRGGAMSRAGFAAVGRCKQPTTAAPPRPIPYQFSLSQAYILEFGDNYLRFVFQGGYVLESPIASTGVTQANPAVASVTGTPFTNGDWVFASGFVGMTQLNGNTYIVAAESSGQFTLHDLNGNPVDSTGFDPYVSGGEFSRLYTIATPYAAVDLPYLKFSQSADVMSLTCSNPVTGTEYPPFDLTRHSGNSWSLAQTDFDPVIMPPATASAVANAQAPTSGVNASFAYVVTAVDAKGNESLASPIATCHGANLQTEAGTNTVTWAAVQLARYYNVYRAPPSVDNGSTRIPVPAGSIFGFVGSAFGTQLADNNSVSDISQVPPTHQNPFAEGTILAVQVTSGGSGLTAVTYSITTTAGINFSGIPVVVGGSLAAFLITDGGSGFEPGDSIAFNAEGFATGAVLFGSTNPSANDTVTLNGVQWTFVTVITAPDQTVIQGSLSATLAQFVSDVSASANAALTVAAYTVDSTNANVIITYKAPGTAGNAYTLAASRASVSAPTLTGGSGSGSSGVNASGSMTFGLGNPTNGQTIVLDGVTWTFVTSGASGNQTNLGASLALTLTQLQLDLTASGNASIALANYAVTTTVLNITYKTVGTVGNTYTLGAGTAGPTLSAGTLTGGVDAATTPAATLIIGPETGTFPGVNVYFQQRHFFACSLNNPDTFWASQTGLFDNFDASTPTVATDAVTASPWTEEVNGIQWLIPMPGGLIAMTGRRAWQILGEGSYILNVQPITPSTVQAQPQAFNGSSPIVPPIVIDYDVLYAEAVGNTTVRDLSWTAYTNIYTGVDLTILSSHLFLYREITQWAWARNPYKVVWSCCTDGTMLSLTYLKEQEVYGWARHDTQGLVVGMTAVTEPPVDAVYIVAQRFPPSPAPATGIYVMERADNRIWQSVEDAYAVDSGVSNPMLSPSAALFASSLTGSVTFRASASVFSAAAVGQVIRMGGGIALVLGFTNATTVTAAWALDGNAGPSGLPYAPGGTWTIAEQVTTLNAPHLAGMTLVGLADGVPIPGVGDPPIVAGPTGLVTLPFPASNVKVGLPFLPQLQTPYLNGPQVAQGSRKVIPSATVRMASSAQFMFGVNRPDGAAQNPPQLGPAWNDLSVFDPLNATGGQRPPIQYTTPGGATATALWTGDLFGITGTTAEWNSKGQVAIQQNLPLALEVTSIEPNHLDGDAPEEAEQPRQSGPQGGQQARGPGRWMLGAGGARI